MNRFLGCLLLAAVTVPAFPQGGTVSPYSQFGYGDQTLTGGNVNRGMNGLGVAMHQGNVVNPSNPASYAYVDSLTMLFDMGVSGQITNFNENGTKFNAKDASFDYAMGSFRVWKDVGMTFGILPFTNIDYGYTTSTFIAEANNTMTTTNGGNGGLHKLFLGVGAKPLKNLAVGANVSYMWGYLDRVVATSSSVTTVNTLLKYYKADIKNYTLDIGVQYDLQLSKDNLLTLGATYGLGHKLNADAECLIISSNSSISRSDTTKFVVENAFELPHTFGVGATLNHGGTWLVGADVQMQAWGKTKFPEYGNGQYTLKSDLLKNSYMLTLGGEWCPRWNSRNFFHRIRYRAGVGYATPYYKINGQDGPKQLSASLGFGIPIMNAYNSRSVLNVSAQWVNRSADGLIKENTFRLNLGLTFNERWFAKWKVE